MGLEGFQGFRAFLGVHDLGFRGLGFGNLKLWGFRALKALGLCRLLGFRAFKV